MSNALSNSPVSDAVRSTIESINTTWNQALNGGNAAALAALYAEDAKLSPGNGETIVGRAEIEKLFQSFIDNGVHNHAIDIIEVGGNNHLADQVARWSANGAETDGKTPAFGGILMGVLEKQANGTWLARSHVWNVSN